MPQKSPSIRIDLNQFKLHISIKNKIELTLIFDSPSRKFYLSIIAFVVNEMKKLAKVTSIPLQKHIELIALLNTTVGSSAGSSGKENLLTRIYRKWKDALPNLEEAPLFRILGRKKEYAEGVSKTYQLTEAEKDIWANLFEYKGSGENVRLRFSIDRLEIGLEDVAIEFDGHLNGEAWEYYVTSLEKPEIEPIPPPAVQEPENESFLARILKIRWPGPYRLAALFALAVVISGLVGLTLWKTYGRVQKGQTAAIEKMAFPLPDTASIAVLPFTNMSGDPKQEYLADGITEEIITALAKIRKLFVIARNSTFLYKGKAVRVQQVAEELGVRYVLEGSIRTTGEKMRITAQLTDALGGQHLWAERYDQDFKNLFAMQDDITIKILTAMRVNLTEGEGARAFAKGTKNLDAYLKILQAYEERAIFNKESQARARTLAEEAVALDPGYALAYSHLAAALGNEVALGVYDHPQEVLKRAYELAHKAVVLDDSLAWCHIVFGIVNITYKKDYDKGIAEAERAVALEPSSAEAYAQLAIHLSWAGCSEQAIPFYKKAFRLSPTPAPRWLFFMASDYITMGQYEKAIAILKKLAEKQPDQIFAHSGLAIAYILTGRAKQAKAEAAEILRIDPNYSLDKAYASLPIKDQKEINRRKEALRKAGLK